MTKDQLITLRTQAEEASKFHLLKGAQASGTSANPDATDGDKVDADLAQMKALDAAVEAGVAYKKALEQFRMQEAI